MMPNSLVRQLRELPERTPPAGSWARLERRMDQRRGRVPKAAVATALAASVGVLALIGFRNFALVPSAAPQPERPLTNFAAEVRRLPELQARSRDLEAMLRNVPEGPQLFHADTRSGVGELQGRIATIDKRLRELDSAARRSPASAQLWRERVDVLNQLVKLRYQQAGLESF